MSNVPLPRPGPLGLIQYAGIDMLQYAGEVSAAKDAEIAALREALDIAINWLHEDRCIFSRLKEVLRESGHE